MRNALYRGGLIRISCQRTIQVPAKQTLQGARPVPDLRLGESWDILNRNVDENTVNNR